LKSPRFLPSVVFVRPNFSAVAAEAAAIAARWRREAQVRVAARTGAPAASKEPRRAPLSRRQELRFCTGVIGVSESMIERRARSSLCRAVGEDPVRHARVVRGREAGGDLGETGSRTRPGVVVVEHRGLRACRRRARQVWWPAARDRPQALHDALVGESAQGRAITS